MAQAQFALYKCIGAGAANEVECTDEPCFLSLDNASFDPKSAPLLPPDAGSSYSFEAWFRLVCTTAPNTQCSNFKVWAQTVHPDGDANPANKLTVYIGTTATAATPVATVSSVATSDQHTTYYDSTHALSVGVVPGDGKIDAVGEKTNYIVVQMKVDTGAAQGQVAGVEFHWSYEEI